jgi:hypothetical protein
MRGIQFRRGVYLIVGTMLVLATSACSSSDSEDLYGVWITPGSSIHMSLNEDGSYDIVHPEDPDRIRGWGTFTFDGELLTFSTDPDDKNCSRMTGTYEAAFTAEGDLELNDLEDPCVVRRVDLRGTLVRYSP